MSDTKDKATYGVFVWRGDGGYKKSDAIKIYKSASAAQKFADKNIASNYVVRNMSLISR